MFYKVLKYALTVVFLLIVGLAAYNFSDSDTAVQQPVHQPGQTKFNF